MPLHAPGAHPVQQPCYAAWRDSTPGCLDIPAEHPCAPPLPHPTPPHTPHTHLPQVHKFNGTPVRNLRHLAEMVLACTDTHMRFDVDYSVRGPRCWLPLG